RGAARQPRERRRAGTYAKSYGRRRLDHAPRLGSGSAARSRRMGAHADVAFARARRRAAASAPTTTRPANTITAGIAATTRLGCAPTGCDVGAAPIRVPP